jgi:hypothetical protein
MHTGFDGRKIISDIHYDDLGRVKQASLPYFEDEQRYFVTTEYDAVASDVVFHGGSNATHHSFD